MIKELFDSIRKVLAELKHRGVTIVTEVNGRVTHRLHIVITSSDAPPQTHKPATSRFPISKKHLRRDGEDRTRTTFQPQPSIQQFTAIGVLHETPVLLHTGVKSLKRVQKKIPAIVKRGKKYRKRQQTFGTISADSAPSMPPLVVSATNVEVAPTEAVFAPSPSPAPAPQPPPKPQKSPLDLDREAMASVELPSGIRKIPRD